MIKLYAAIMAFLFLPHTQVLSIKQSTGVLDVSVLIRAKQYSVDEKTFIVKRGMVGCSGTFVAGDKVLTAAHCFSLATTDVWVRDPHVRWGFRARILKLDPEHDLALLQVEKMANHPYAKLAAGARIGEQIINVGSPVIFEFLVSEGIVAALRYHDKTFKSTYMITTAMINSGSSGGGAFNSNGELLGVNTMSIGPFGWAGISMAVDIESIRGFLNGNL